MQENEFDVCQVVAILSWTSCVDVYFTDVEPL